MSLAAPIVLTDPPTLRYGGGIMSLTYRQARLLQVLAMAFGESIVLQRLLQCVAGGSRAEVEGELGAVMPRLQLLGLTLTFRDGACVLGGKT